MGETPIRFSIVTRSRSRQGSTSIDDSPDNSFEELGQRIHLDSVQEEFEKSSDTGSELEEDQETLDNRGEVLREVTVEEVRMAEARGPFIPPLSLEVALRRMLKNIYRPLNELPGQMVGTMLRS